MEHETSYVKYYADRTVMFDFVDGHWYINGIRPPTDQYRQLYLDHCMDEDFKAAEKRFLAPKVRKTSDKKSSSKEKSKKKSKKFSFSIKL